MVASESDNGGGGSSSDLRWGWLSVVSKIYFEKIDLLSTCRERL